jgi:hypothetical protein
MMALIFMESFDHVGGNKWPVDRAVPRGALARPLRATRGTPVALSPIKALRRSREYLMLEAPNGERGYVPTAWISADSEVQVPGDEGWLRFVVPHGKTWTNCPLLTVVG